MRRGEVAKGSAWALVTGAGSGIGRCFALRLARLGYRLVLVGNDLRKLESVQAELRALDAAEVRVISCDLARAEAARELYERVRAAGIDVDVLINNAGIFSFRDILRTPAERIERVIMLHCLTATQLCRLFARDMAARNGFAANPEAEPRAVTDMATPATQTGECSDTQSVPAMPTDGRPGTQPAPRHAKRRFHILNMASYSLWMPFPGLTLYSASKAYLKCFSVAFAKEVREAGIRVTAVCPAGVATNLYGLTPRWQRIGLRLGVLISADHCARRGLWALWHGRRCSVPDWWNRLWIPLCKLLPMCVIRPIRNFTMKFQK